MTRLRRSDLEATLDFLVDVGELEFDDPYPLEFVTRLQDLVPCDGITYQELDPHLRRTFTGIGFGPDTEGEGDYWRVAPCPTLAYRERTGDLEAVRTSDLISRRRFRELPVFREYFEPLGLDHVLDLGLPADRPRFLTFVLFRRIGASDFSERDRAVLEVLRPHLYRIEAHAALRRRLAEALREPDDDEDPSVFADLTPREREIVELVAEGKTNAEIAAQLWVAPSTVKKHLEHVYAKIGVGRRAAAARYVAHA